MSTLAAYAFLSAAAFSLSEKYQKEILWPGQAYMSLPVIQFFLMVLVIQSLRFDREHFRNLVAVGIIALSLNLTLNSILVYNMYLRNKASTELISGLLENNNAKRCKLLETWTLENRPAYFEVLTIESIQKTRTLWFGDVYCDIKY
jgi:hypothetical protein